MGRWRHRVCKRVSVRTFDVDDNIVFTAVNCAFCSDTRKSREASNELDEAVYVFVQPGRCLLQPGRCSPHTTTRDLLAIKFISLKKIDFSNSK